MIVELKQYSLMSMNKLRNSLQLLAIHSLRLRKLRRNKIFTCPITKVLLLSSILILDNCLLTQKFQSLSLFTTMFAENLMIRSSQTLKAQLLLSSLSASASLEAQQLSLSIKLVSTIRLLHQPFPCPALSQTHNQLLSNLSSKTQAFEASKLIGRYLIRKTWRDLIRIYLRQVLSAIMVLIKPKIHTSSSLMSLNQKKAKILLSRLHQRGAYLVPEKSKISLSLSSPIRESESSSQL